MNISSLKLWWWRACRTNSDSKSIAPDCSASITIDIITCSIWKGISRNSKWKIRMHISARLIYTTTTIVRRICKSCYICINKINWICSSTLLKHIRRHSFRCVIQCVCWWLRGTVPRIAWNNKWLWRCCWRYACYLYIA